ncbi:PREDICTED: moesin-like [Thamnophis sirtalis]|uniref:Moesin-like n=1 Tax=Thamnophis sirtalis TaxID=35019 RepID=A0A6I9XIB1_9SAUR|nr:PREDICTED: moesin-like [Thamnophis sirtalis]
MGGLLTCRQCSTRMESLKDHSFWDLTRTGVKNCFWFILVTFIVLTLLWIILYSRAPPEPGRICPKDQANLLHNISQMEAEKVTLRKQLIEMEKEMQKLRNVTNRTQGKSLQLLEKKQEEVDALSKELSGYKQSFVLTRQLLEKEKEKGQSLQSELQSAKEDLQKIQQQRDSWQKELKTLEEKLKSPDSKAEEYKRKVADLQRQLEQERKNRDFDKHERASYQNRIGELNYQIDNQKKCSTLDTFVAWALGILLISFSCCFCAGCWKLVQ